MKADYVWACMCVYGVGLGVRTVEDTLIQCLISVGKCGEKMNKSKSWWGLKLYQFASAPAANVLVCREYFYPYCGKS